jgi:two-component sensor histidine kinase
MLLILLVGERAILLIGNQLFSLASGILLLWGSHVWGDRHIPRIWIWVSVACGVWFAPWGYLLGALFSLISAIGIILVYFERAREALRESEEKFKSIINSSNDVMVLAEEKARAHISFLDSIMEQVISSLLDFQAQYTADEQAVAALCESQRRIRAMALIHEQLYQPAELANVDMAAYIRQLTDDLSIAYQRSAKAIQLQVDARDVFLDVRQAVPCGLLVNELVTNALKHAFPDAAVDLPHPHRVHITFDKTSENRYHPSISDNGVGLPPDFSFPNSGGVHRQGTLGLFLVDVFVQQLGGRIAWHGRGGTRCEIAFVGNEDG